MPVINLALADAEFVDRLVGTLTARWYVFVFLAGYVFVAWAQVGRARMLAHLVTGYAIAWASEMSSIRNGFPYGEYFYRYDSGLAHDLLVGPMPAVPLFDSLSYVFLTYIGYSTAVTLLAPLARRGADVQWLATPRLRHSQRVCLLGATITMLVDVVVDPIAHKGGEWFLGSVYGYAQSGWYFEIPLSNFAGWWLVAYACIFVLQRTDAFFVRRERRSDSPRPRPYVPGAGWMGLGLLWGVLLFNLAVTAWVGLTRAGAGNTDGARTMYLLLACGFAWHAPIVVWAIVRLRRAKPGSRE